MPLNKKAYKKMRKKRPITPPVFRGIFLLCFILIIGVFFSAHNTATAEEKIEEKTQSPIFKSAQSHYNTPSTNQTGMLGLNTIPSARMDEAGTVRIGTSASDPYIHGFMGFQLAKPLYVSLRQTAEVSNLKEAADDLYPGLDVKLRLVEETQTRPAIALGFDSAIGHKRMGSEYLTFSKRFNNFDLTGGMAWGRLGSAGHIKNPMRTLSSHFNKKRNYNSALPQDINNWFTGEDIGFFGGVEYFTPLKGLSVKADYGANDYVGEEAINGFNAPAPWSLGINYQPWEQASFSTAVIGGNKIMARFSLQDQIFNWPIHSSAKGTAPDLISPRPNERKEEEEEEERKNFSLLNLFSSQPTARQIGRQTKILANNSPFELESLEIKTSHKGLTGPSVTIIRRDLEEATLNNHGSPEEIWQDAIINPNSHSFKGFFKNNDNYNHALRLILDHKLSLSEQDAGTLYRSSLLIEAEKELPYGFLTGGGLRINLKDNLSRLRKYRLITATGIRSNEVDFAERRFSIDRLYGSWLRSLSNSTHIALTGGYLEEMYTGLGAEILYRPFGKTFAVGAEGWRAFKRDPDSTLNRDYFNTPVFTGHLNLFYEVPNSNITTFAKVGQYLGTDRGATLGVKTTFDNGATLEGSITSTDLPFTDLNGDKTHLYWGVRLGLPLGNIPFVPNGSKIRLKTGPFARDTGQVLDHPLPLYEVTEPISSRQLNHSWKSLLD